MNTLKDIRDKFKISKEEAITILGKSGSTIDRYDKEPISNLSVNQLISLHREKQIPYNTLLGETIFTLSNINTKDNIQAISILDNENEYNRLLDRLKKDLNK